MADLGDLSTRYIIKTKQPGLSNALASTPSDDILIITPFNQISSQLWYRTETEIKDYYRLHTEDKGDDVALSIYNYEGRQTLDLRFLDTSLNDGGYGSYGMPQVTGQYWHFEEQIDGTFKISNNKTGPDTYLDIDDDSSKPMLANRDSPLQKWIFSSLGSSPTSTGTAVASTTLTASFTPTTASTLAPVASSTCLSDCVGSSNSSKKLTSGVIAGIAVGSVAALALGGAMLIWFLLRRRPTTSLPKPIELRPAVIFG